MQTASYDLLIRAGRVVCPVSDFDAPGMIAVRGDRIAAMISPVTSNSGPGSQVAAVPPSAHATLDFPNALLLPGLIDLHAHPSCSASEPGGAGCRGSVFGITPDEHCLSRGSTTVMSQGDAGADDCATYIDQTIHASRTRIVLAINLARCGETKTGGCFANLADADINACVAAIAKFRQHIWGLALNASHHACGTNDPREIVRRGLIVAKEAGVPILYGMRRPEDWPLAEQLALLRAGDVVTYCFRSTPHCIVERGRVLPEIRAARQRGVLFDVGHGCGSFDFEVAEQAIADGFLPDSISSDLQRGHLGQTPIHDLPLVMSKLRAAGMAEHDVFAAVTSGPALCLGLTNEIGSLRAGARADFALLHWTDTADPLADTHGHTRQCGRWQTVAVIRAGKLVTPNR